MTDKAKVLRGLNCIADRHISCGGCGYKDNPLCFYEVAEDAITLLEEQEEEIKNLMTALDNISAIGREC